MKLNKRSLEARLKALENQAKVISNKEVVLFWQLMKDGTIKAQITGEGVTTYKNLATFEAYQNKLEKNCDLISIRDIDEAEQEIEE